MSRYLEIREKIRNRIINGHWRQGERLPSEIVLAREFGVNRATIRQALRALEQERLLTSRQGSGRLVNPRANRVVSNLAQLESTDRLLSVASSRVEKRLVEYCEVQLQGTEAEALRLQPCTPVWRMVRQRYVGTFPAAVSVNIFPTAFAPPEPVTGSILTDLDERGFSIEYAETEILVPTPDDPYTSLLRTDQEGVPIILLRQLHFDWRHTPIFLAYDYLNANVFSLRVTRNRLNPRENVHSNQPFESSGGELS